MKISLQCMVACALSLLMVAEPALSVPCLYSGNNHLSLCSLTIVSEQALLLPVVNTVASLSQKSAAWEHRLTNFRRVAAIGIPWLALIGGFAGLVMGVFIADSSPTLATVVTTTGLSPKEELTTLQRVLPELYKEKRRRGSGQLPRIIAISDEHGTIDRFDALILDAIRLVAPGTIPPGLVLDPKRGLQDQLAMYRVRAPEDLQGKLYFHNLGDLMDRGPNGIQVFRRSKELIEMGLSDFVLGNHCNLVFQNLQGFHLPFYEGYNLYNYTDGLEQRFGNVNDILTKYHRDNALTKTKSWWAAHLAEFTAYQKEQQANPLRWKRFDQRVNEGPDALFARIKPFLTPGSDQDQLWEQFHGFNSHHTVPVYTGVRAVGEMSIGWWRHLRDQFQQAHDAVPPESAVEKQAWADALAIMDEIIPALEQEVIAKVEEGKPWWRIFEALNSQNYSSPEWYAKDWLFHDDWGTSVMKERNLELPPDKQLTPANYLEDPVLQEIANFYRAHYVLHIRDIYQHDYMHAFLPMDENTGEFYFTYDGQEYRGKGSVDKPSWQDGLALISRRIRNKQMTMHQLYEAYTLVNGWYADNSTKVKERHVAAAINRFGDAHLAEVNGFYALSTGHLPFEGFRKLKEELGQIKGFLVGRHIIFTDHGAGKKFGRRGGYVSYSPVDGLRLRGYRSKESTHGIEWNPPTAEVKDGVESIIFENTGLSREDFLEKTIRDIKSRIEFLVFQAPSNSKNAVLIPLPRDVDAQQLANDIFEFGMNAQYYEKNPPYAHRPELDIVGSGGQRYIRLQCRETLGIFETDRVLATSGNLILGLANFTLSKVALHLGWIAVATPFQKHGVGEALMGWLFQKARNEHVSTLQAKSNSEYGTITHFYEKVAARFKAALTISSSLRPSGSEDRADFDEAHVRYTITFQIPPQNTPPIRSAA